MPCFAKGAEYRFNETLGEDFRVDVYFHQERRFTYEYDVETQVESGSKNRIVSQRVNGAKAEPDRV